MKALALVLLLAACGGGDPLPPGAACTAADDCDTGLDCLEVKNTQGSSCTTVGHECTVTCTDDTPCALLGTAFHCIGQCGGGPMFCAQLAP